MNESTLQGSRGGLLSGFLGIVSIPLLIFADSLLAIRRGWSPASAGALGLLVYLSALVPLLVFASLAVGPLRRFIRRRATALWVASFAVLVGWLVANVAIAAMAHRAAFHLRPPGVEYQFEPDPYAMPGVFGSAVYRTNQQGIRGSELPDDDATYRILCVGGGATENLFIDDARTWPQLVMQRLNQADGDRATNGPQSYWIGAAGVLDYAASHHARFLERARCLRQIDCAVMLVGANDVARYVMGLPTEADVEPWWYRTPLFDTLKYVWNAVLEKGYYVDRTGTHLMLLRLGRNIPPRPLDFDTEIEAYKRRLRRAIAAARQRELRLILVTHPVLWDYFLTTQGSKRLWLARVNPYPRDWDFLNAADLVDVMQRYNDALISVAQEENVEYIDAASAMNGNELLFYDDFHFNQRGCEVFADIVAQYLSEHPPHRSTAN